MKQRTEEWFNARLGKATASRFKDVMATIKSGEAASRKNYRAQLVVERLTGVREESSSPAVLRGVMQWGIDHENAAREAYEDLTGNLVEEYGFMSHLALAAGCSPDGLIGDLGMIEIKCPNTAQHITCLQTQDMPKEHWWQVQGQLWIANREWCDFVSFDPRMPEHMQIMVKRVARHPADIADLNTGVRAFLAEVDKTVNELQEQYGDGI